MSDGELVLTGWLVDGPDVDLVAMSGLDLSDEEQDRVWGETSTHSLLEDEVGCECVQSETFDGRHGMSDVWVEYRCGPREEFVVRLRGALTRLSGREL